MDCLQVLLYLYLYSCFGEFVNKKILLVPYFHNNKIFFSEKSIFFLFYRGLICIYILVVRLWIVIGMIPICQFFPYIVNLSQQDHEFGSLGILHYIFNIFVFNICIYLMNLILWNGSGDVDSVVPVTATRYALAQLKLKTKVPWYPWYVKKQVSLTLFKTYVQLINASIVSILKSYCTSKQCTKFLIQKYKL